MKKLIHLECGDVLEVSKPEAKEIRASGKQTLQCDDCGKQSRILNMSVPKEEEEVPAARRDGRNYGQGRKRR